MALRMHDCRDPETLAAFAEAAKASERKNPKIMRSIAIGVLPWGAEPKIHRAHFKRAVTEMHPGGGFCKGLAKYSASACLHCAPVQI
jgi:hypothetical protein